MVIANQAENKWAVEVIAAAPEAVPSLPFLRILKEDVERLFYAVPGGEVDFEIPWGMGRTLLSVISMAAWANSVAQVLDLGVRVEALVNEAVAAKDQRRAENKQERVAFISHSTKDKPFVRKLAADLVSNGVRVWLDEQQILVGDPIPEKIAQGLAESDFFLLVVSHNSVQSSWVKKELNNALVQEIERRKVTVLPIKLDDSNIPESVGDKLYADFTRSYEDGLNKLLSSIRAREVSNANRNR